MLLLLIVVVFLDVWVVFFKNKIVYEANITMNKNVFSVLLTEN